MKERHKMRTFRVLLTDVREENLQEILDSLLELAEKRLLSVDDIHYRVMNDE